MARTAILTAPLILLAACTREAPTDTPASPEMSCGAGKLGDYVGKEANAEVQSTLSALSGGKIRVAGPRDAITMDYRPDRLNVELDERGKIKRLRCG
jgi:Peptidase inhibitor I78 family